jgi:hypothetical protein
MMRLHLPVPVPVLESKAHVTSRSPFLIRDSGLPLWNLDFDRWIFATGEYMPDIQSMIGKEVEVIAGGMTYRGVLIEVSDAEVHLKSSMQWIALPVSSVSAIKLAGEMTRESEREGILPEGDRSL